MFDQDGRVWYTSRIRDRANPDFCREGSDPPSARLTPVENSGRHVSVYDPATFEPVDHPDASSRILAAAWMGSTRLIDNIPFAG